MSEDVSSIQKRYEEYLIALEHIKSSGRKRDKTQSMIEGAAWELYRILRDSGVHVESP